VHTIGGALSKPTDAPAIYLAIVLELERRRHACGISMDEMSELMGSAERSYAKLVHPTTASGRFATWPKLQQAIDVLWCTGFRLTIDTTNDGMLTTVGTRRKILHSSATYNRRTRRELMRDLSLKAAAARREKIPSERRSEIAARAAQARWNRRKSQGASTDAQK
jgi:hypothetical protein